MSVFDKVVSINISDYKDEDHFINGSLHFTYSEFLDIFGFDYDKSVMRVNISKADEDRGKIKYAIQEAGKEIITGSVWGN